MKNKLAYLGFLGFIGLLGIYWRSFSHTAFLVFFFFFSYSKIISDELFKENLRKAALRAFVVNMTFNLVIMSITTFVANRYQFTEPDFQVMYFGYAGFILNFVVSILVFVFTLMHFTHQDRSVLE